MPRAARPAGVQGRHDHDAGARRNPLGIKGCGEAGAIAAPAAVINAITDAIGTEELTMPATAQTVWSALQKVNNSRKAA